MIETVIGLVKLSYESGKWLKNHLEKKKLVMASENLNEDVGILIVAEIGRPIVQDVEEQLGKPFAVISAKRTVSKEEIGKLAGDIYKAVAKVSKLTKGQKITLVLSGPVVLNFILGQFVGLGHFNLNLGFWQNGSYQVIPSAVREDMF